MTRIHILCDSPKTLSGFSKVGEHLYEGLEKLGHEVFMTGFQTTYIKENWSNGIVLPITTQYIDDLSQYIMNVQKCKADICICIFNADDAGPNEFAKAVKNTCFYVPVEGGNIPDLMIRDLLHVSESGKIIAQCNWGHDEMMKCGIDSEVIYHGFDDKIFKRLNNDEKISKIHRNEVVTLMKYTEGNWTPTFVSIEDLRNEFSGKFIFGFVGANHGLRKRIERLLTAYSIFLNFPGGSKEESKRRKENTLLVLRTMPISITGINLIKVCADLEVSSNVVFMFGEDNRLSDEAMNVIYNCFDVNVSASSSEGFGFSTLESMAVGVPQIGPNCSSFIELIGNDDDARGLISSDGMWQMIPDNSYRYIVNENDMAKKMGIMYNDNDLRRKCSENAAKFAQQYTWTKVLKQWDTLINNFTLKC